MKATLWSSHWRRTWFGSSRAWTVGLTLGILLWVVMPYPRGALMAYFDHARGHYELKSYGLPGPWDEECAERLKEKYDVELNRVAGCEITPWLAWYAGAYSSVSERLLRE